MKVLIWNDLVQSSSVVSLCVIPVDTNSDVHDLKLKLFNTATWNQCRFTPMADNLARYLVIH